MIITVILKAIYLTGQLPKYLSGQFQMRTYGDQANLLLAYVTYVTSATMWNGLSEDLRSITSFNDFNSKVRQIGHRQNCQCNTDM